ncbi:hypothetical protein F511_27290 [Dorcoceras hygrometricum]|uniref:Uncharacterized protein n=1 Tax=Dorcoceras hygrometricum TaxID=472368 RepID=A0A2Z7D903_9LAMI|nr:hypothetical protein F511_27290 [Dorcoceras hygrometricum]
MHLVFGCSITASGSLPHCEHTPWPLLLQILGAVLEFLSSLVGNPGSTAGRGFNPVGGAPGGNPGFTAGRGYNPAGGAPGGEAHGWEPRSTNAITTKTTYWKLKPRLGTRSHHKGTKFYLHYKTHNRAATSRSSTSQPQSPKVVWNDRASQEESKATSHVPSNGRKRWELPEKSYCEQHNQQVPTNSRRKEPAAEFPNNAIQNDVAATKQNDVAPLTSSNLPPAGRLKPSAGSQIQKLETRRWFIIPKAGTSCNIQNAALQLTKRRRIATSANPADNPRAIPAARYSSAQISCSWTTSRNIQTTTFPPRATGMLTRVDICFG